MADILCDKLSFTAAEAYKLLRANLMFTLPRNSGKSNVIGVTSAIRGEGKSTTSINLAYVLAETGAKVLLVDADMRLPSVAKKLNIKGDKGLSNYLAGLCDINDAIVASGILNNLFIMPAGVIPPNPSELLASVKLKALVEAASSGIEYIVMDLPPVNIVSDALVVSSIADGMIVTVRQNYSDKKSLDACIKQMQLVNAKIAGFVFNDASEAGTHYGKYKKYSKYYRKYTKAFGSRYDYGYDYDYDHKRKARAKTDSKDQKTK